MARKLKAKEVRERLLAHLDSVATYAERESSRWNTPREKIRGAIFSVLAALDGSAIGLPSFTVCPAPHPDDREYNQSRGENYYPDENEHVDIAGELHSEWAQRYGR